MTVKQLFHSPAHFGIGYLIFFFCHYYGFLLLTLGLPLPAGNFVSLGCFKYWRTSLLFFAILRTFTRGGRGWGCNFGVCVCVCVCVVCVCVCVCVCVVCV
jgi:hypothetical protein